MPLLGLNLFSGGIADAPEWAHCATNYCSQQLHFPLSFFKDTADGFAIAQSCSRAQPATSSWPDPSVKGKMQWHVFDPAPPSNEVLPMAGGWPATGCC